METLTYLPFVQGIHWSPMDSLHKGFSMWLLLCRTSDWSVDCRWFEMPPRFWHYRIGMFLLQWVVILQCMPWCSFSASLLRRCQVGWWTANRNRAVEMSEWVSDGDDTWYTWEGTWRKKMVPFCGQFKYFAEWKLPYFKLFVKFVLKGLVDK